MSNLGNLLTSGQNYFHIQLLNLNTKFPIKIIVAATISGGIGFNGNLPWPKLTTDMKHFQYITTKTMKKDFKNAVIMGKNTWLSIPEKYRPLKNRINFILSTSILPEDINNEAHVVNSLENIIGILETKYSKSVESIFIIGGEQLYKNIILSKLASTIFLTRINQDFLCDKYFPEIDPKDYCLTSISKTFTNEKVSYDFVVYSSSKSLMQLYDNQEESQIYNKFEFDLEKSFFQNNNLNSIKYDFTKNLSSPFVKFRDHEEFQYLDCITNILNNGIEKPNRTGVGTLSLFGYNMRFCLRNTFPLLTTKRVFWRGVVEELLWFIKGSTNGNILLEKGIKIWKKNGSREYLDSIGLNEREENDLGPIYGFQWRHFGADYIDMHTNYKDQGFDQLLSCIEQLKNNKNDRRIILTSWNPLALSKMALPPCHIMCQFYVAGDELSCMMVQRSCDIGLGVPFNIASYSLLTCMIAQVCNLKRGDFYYCLGDTHIYTNHIDSLKEQLKREPRPFPILEINPNIQDIEKFTEADIKLLNYNPHKKIEMDMAV